MAENTLDLFTMRLFGPFQIVCEGHPLPPPRTHKGKWLLALLTLRHGKEVQRTWLADLLWPDSDNALGSLNTSLYDLRKKLGTQAKRIRATPRTLTLDLTDAQVDLLAFDAAVAHPESLSDLQTAIALYTRPLLEDCTETWVVEERQARATAYVTALETLATRALTDGNRNQAIEYLRKAVAVEETLEKTHRWLMELLAAEGDYTEAMQVYRDLKQRLQQESKRDPEAATTALYQHIRRKAHRRATTPTRVAVSIPPAEPYAPTIPRPLTALLGREEELQGIMARVLSSHLLTLTGPGGVGKTRLATEVALEMAADFAHGAYLIELEALTDPTFIPQHLARMLGVEGTAGGDWEQAITGYLSGRQVLLVLDNCEHLLAGCADLVRRLLGSCRGLHLLATSRERLGLTGEVVWNVPPLAVPDGSEVDLRQCLDNPAIALFCERARAVRPHFVLTAQNVVAVLEICRRLDGLPLALELAAALLETLTVHDIAARLDERFHLLQARGPTTRPTRHSALEIVLEWSCSVLSPTQRKLLCCLCAFADGWTLDAAEAVYAAQGGQRRETLTLLAQLVTKSLVVSKQEHIESRYGMLESMRAYGQERLTEPPVWQQIRRAHGEHYTALAEETAPQLMGASQVAALDLLEREQANLRAALAWATGEGSDPEMALRLAGALFRFYYVRGYHEEGKTWLQRALQMPCRQEDGLRLKAMRGLGNLHSARGEHQAARPCFEECRVLAETLQDRRAQAAALASLATIEVGEHNYTRGREMFDEALPHFEALGDRRSMAVTLSHLAKLACQDGGNYEAAYDLHVRAIELFRQVESLHEIALECNNFAHTLLHLGRFAEVYPYLEESVLISEQLGSLTLLAHSLNQYGSLAIQEGDLERAAVLMEAQVALRDRINAPLPDWALAEYQHAQQTIRQSLDPARLHACRTRGREMNEEEVRAYVLKRSG